MISVSSEAFKRLTKQKVVACAPKVTIDFIIQSFEHSNH